MLKLAHIAIALTGSTVLGSCLLFLLALVHPVFMENTLPLIDEIRNYLFDFKKPLLIGHPHLNSNEERHLLDVKRLFQNIGWITLLAIMLATSGLLLLPQPRVTIKYMGESGLIGLALITIGLSLSGFRNGFIWLHSWLFLPDSWWFSEESALIQLFPLAFFQKFAMIYTLLLILVFSICWWVNRNSP